MEGCYFLIYVFLYVLWHDYPAKLVNLTYIQYLQKWGKKVFLFKLFFLFRNIFSTETHTHTICGSYNEASEKVYIWKKNVKNDRTMTC